MYILKILIYHSQSEGKFCKNIMEGLSIDYS